MERQGVVDRIHAAVGAEQTVAGLAIGVVGHQVEETNALKPLGMRGVLAQREVVLGEIRLDEELEGPLAVGPVALDRQRDQAPLERLRQRIRGDFAAEEPRRKIPEWPLAALGLVDGLDGDAVAGDVDEEDGVAAAGHTAPDGDVAAREHAQRVSA